MRRKPPAIFSTLHLSTRSHPSPLPLPLPPQPTPPRADPDASHWRRLLSAHILAGRLDAAARVLSSARPADPRAHTTLISAYARAGRATDALRLFDAMPLRDAAAWNAAISAAAGCGDVAGALRLFGEMPRADRNVVSWTAAIGALMRAGRVEEARDMFCRMPEKDTACCNAMISGYCSNGRVQDAFELFERMPRKNLISWTAMIGGYDQNGESEKALALFLQMWVAAAMKLTSSTFACAVTACANVPDLLLGRQLHSQVAKFGYLSDGFVSTSLVTMYGNCKQVEDSKRLFDEVGNKNVVSWTAVVTAYNSSGRYEDALKKFCEMVMSGIRPNQSTFTSVLNSCCGLEALDRGKKIHASTVKAGLEFDVFVGTSLIAMYSKCGSMDAGLKVFSHMERRNLVTWNSVIVGCAQNGFSSTALQIFQDMDHSFVQPDQITYVGLLTACSHARLLEKARYFFRLLEADASVDLTLEHYACMVDVLGRCGSIREAEDFIRNMPMEPNLTVWLALLSACRVHGNIEVAQRASRAILDLDPHNSAAFVLMSNIYASACRWSDVLQTRVRMRCQRVMKLIGYSWITIRDARHEFVCGDRSHPMTEEIYKKLDWLDSKLKEYGYIYDKRFALHDVDEEQKEAMLKHHSEKLAIAFGLLSTVQGSTIRVMKNLRVCGACHSSIKLISKIVGREIVLRDSTRFHYFKDGLCSCGDNW